MPAISRVINGLLDLARGSSGAGETLKFGIIDAINAVIDYLPKIGEFAAMIIPLIVDTVVSTLPQLLQAAIDIVVTLADMLIEYLPELIPAAIGMILTLVHGLLNNLPLLIDAAIDLILAIVDGLINSLPIIIEMAPQIIEALINGLVYAIPKLLEAAVAVIVALVSYLTDPNNLLTLVGAGLQIILALGKGMIDNVKNITSLIPSIFTSIKNAFANSGWIEIGKNMINGIITGIKNAIPSLIETLKNAGRDGLNAVKDFLKIKSPSRLFRDEVGKYIPQGIAVGVENEMPETADRIKKNTDVDDMVNGFNTVSRMRANNSPPIQLTVPVYVGNEELKTYTYKAVDSGMKQRGLRDLKTTGGYNT
jgi:phage-related protein